MSVVLSMPLPMINMVSMIPMVPMVVPMVLVIPMVGSIMVLIEGKGVEERFLQPRLVFVFFFTFDNLCELLKLIKLIEFYTGSLRTPGLVSGQHVVKRVEVEEDGGVVLGVGLPLLPHQVHVLLLQQLLVLAGDQGGSCQHQAGDQGGEKCHLDTQNYISLPWVHIYL